MPRPITEVQAEIDRLNEDNRRDRSADKESALVRLRVEAAEAIVGTAPPRLPQTIDAPDQFSEHEGLPEVARNELDATTLASALSHKGALIVRGLLEPEDVALMTHLARTEPRWTDEFFGTLGCSPRVLFALLEIYERSGLTQVVREYIADDVLLFGNGVYLRNQPAEKAATKGGLPWHQDVAFHGRPSNALNCWTAITPCGENTRGLSVLARRNTERFGWDEEAPAPFDYGRLHVGETVRALSKQHPIVRPDFAAGDALLFDEMTLHATAPARSKEAITEQIVSVSWFFRPGGMAESATALAL